MKNTLLALIAFAICTVPSFAQEASLESVKSAYLTQLDRGKVTLNIDGKKAGTSENRKLTHLEYLGALATPGPMHREAVKRLRDTPALSQGVAAYRDKIKALPQTSETRTLLSRVIEPAIAALAAGAKNPSGLTHDNTQAIARLHAHLAAK